MSLLLLLGGASPSVTISAPIAEALASADAPGVTAGGSVNLSAPTAVATADALVPSIVTESTTAAPTAAATADALTPSVVLGVIQAPTATATADALVPSVGVRISTPVAAATAVALVPAIPFITIQAPTATAFAEGPVGALGPTRIGELPLRAQPIRGLVPALGEVAHVFVRKSGQTAYPIVGEWECQEQVPGGSWTSVGRIARQERHDNFPVFQEGTLWQIFSAPSGEMIWEGKLKRPVIEESTVALEADGVGKLVAERPIVKRLLYQTWDLSEWSVFSDGIPFDKDPGTTLDTSTEESTGGGIDWQTEIDSGAIRFVRSGGVLDRGSSTEAGVHGNFRTQFGDPVADSAAWLGMDVAWPGITRLAFDLHVFSKPTSGTPLDYRAEPWPIYMQLSAGRWNERLGRFSQGGFIDPLITWVPDDQGAGQFGFGEQFNWKMHWDISLYYGTAYGFGGPVDFEAAKEAFSDRAGPDGEALALGSGFDTGGLDTISPIWPEGGRLWDNRPFGQQPNQIKPASAMDGDFLGTGTFPNGFFWDPFPINMILLWWEAKTGSFDVDQGTVLAEMKAVHLRVRINGIAYGDHFSASDLVADIAMRTGTRFDRQPGNSLNILPYDIREGTYGDPLDHACLMTNWIWRIIPRGARRNLEFHPWDRSEIWYVTDERSPQNLRPTPTFTEVSVPFQWPNAPSGGMAHVHWRHAPVPRHNYGIVQLDSPMPNRDKAETFGHNFLRRAHYPHWGGEMTVAEVESDMGTRVSAHLIHAGDRVAHRQTGRTMRVQGVRHTYEGVELQLEEENSVLQSIIARANKRMSDPRR